RLCIARALAVEPEVILLDEPASALDPISTAAIEDLMHELKHDFTLVIVTHNMQQAARVADMTAFFSLEVKDGRRAGILVEHDETYVAIELGIQSLLARQTPVAVDLRLVLAMLHINLHLERMADYCVTIAKLLKLVAGLPGEPALVEGFEEMGARAEEMIRVAMDSFAARDAGRAESLVELDEMIDRANRRTVEHVLELAAQPE